MSTNNIAESIASSCMLCTHHLYQWAWPASWDSARRPSSVVRHQSWGTKHVHAIVRCIHTYKDRRCYTTHHYVQTLCPPGEQLRREDASCASRCCWVWPDTCMTACRPSLLPPPTGQRHSGISHVGTTTSSPVLRVTRPALV
jgi:hypothetical protein